MISTFDLTLMGSLVSVGGALFLRKPTWLHREWNRLTGVDAEHHERLDRSTALTGARWLAVGALTLFVAYFHGGPNGYLFGPWSDVFFHIFFVSAAWIRTAYRMKQSAEQPVGRTNAGPISAGSLRES